MFFNWESSHWLYILIMTLTKKRVILKKFVELNDWLLRRAFPNRSSSFLKDSHFTAIFGQFHCTPHGGYSTDPALESMSDCNEGFLHHAPLVQPEWHNSFHNYVIHVSLFTCWPKSHLSESQMRNSFWRGWLIECFKLAIGACDISPCDGTSLKHADEFSFGVQFGRLQLA